MGRPDYEDSVAGSNGDAERDSNTNVGTGYFSRGSSLGRVTEGAKGSNLKRVFGTRVEDDNGPT